MLVVSIYRPTSSNASDFNTEFEEFLDRINHNLYSISVIGGDFNQNFLDINSSNMINYNMILNTHNFKQVIKAPTRIAASNNNISTTLLDHILINRPFNYFSGVIALDLSDHSPTFLNLHLPMTTSPRTEPIKIITRPFSSDNLIKLKHILLNTNWNTPLANINNEEDCENALNYLINILNSSYCSSFPKKLK